MEYQKQEWHISQDGNHHHDDHDDRRDQQHNLTSDAQVPSDLLATVLRRLELAPEQTSAERTSEDLQARLKSKDWFIRAAAMREMGKRQAEIPLELLTSTLNDGDETVRAAAVHVLGNLERQAPLHHLVEALGDADWHVRETAVFALSKQGERIPREVIQTALYDNDFSVREAARLALQWHPADNGASVTYGRLWEQKTMQSEQKMTSSQEDAGHKTSIPGSEPYEIWHDSRNSHTYTSYVANSHIMREQAQGYASEEPVFTESATYEYQHEHEVSPQWQKLTPRRTSHKGWWAALVVTAIVFFLLGAGATTLVTPTVIHSSAPKSEIKNISAYEQLLRDSRYNGIAIKEIAGGLKLDPGFITQQLRTGTSMIDIAASQGVDAQKLHSVELKAFTDVADYWVQSRLVGQGDLVSWQARLQKDPAFLDNDATILFWPGVIPPGYGIQP
jgi:HEAT repeats